MDYRSLSFHHGIPDRQLVELGGRLGFNDVCLQTESGTLGPLVDTRERLESDDFFEFVDDLGMSTSLWVHEFEEYVQNWGEMDVRNPNPWDGLQRKYEFVLGDLFPDLDHLLLTVVESERWVTDLDELVLLVESIHEVCERHDTELVFRTFTWHPDERETVEAAVERFPDPVQLMSKCVPQDWNYRSIDNPLLELSNGRDQIAEIDIVGEFQRLTHLPNAFTEESARRLSHWQDLGLDGMSVRVTRVETTEEPPWRRFHTVRGEAQEANLWTLGLLATGEAADLNDVWRAYTEHRFGEAAAAVMEDTLRPTHEVVDAGIYVDREIFGSPHWKRIPGARTMEGRTAELFSDLAAERGLYAEEPCDGRYRTSLDLNPFARNWAVWRWDENARPIYHELRKGHPGVVEAKREAYADALDTVDTLNARLEDAATDLPEEAYTYFRAKLAEARFHLEASCEMHLAWLEASNRLYYSPSDTEYSYDESGLKQRLDRLEELARPDADPITCEWLGEQRRIEPGVYLDVPGFLALFRSYWKLE